jgi:hypothetical protein
MSVLHCGQVTFGTIDSILSSCKVVANIEIPKKTADLEKPISARSVSFYPI